MRRRDIAGTNVEDTTKTILAAYIGNEAQVNAGNVPEAFSPDDQSNVEEAFRAHCLIAKSIAALCPSLSFTVNLQTRQSRDVSQTMQRSLEYTPEQMRAFSNPVPLLLHPDDTRQFWADLGALDGMPPDAHIVQEFRMRHANGGDYHLRARTVVLTRTEDGHAREVLCVAVDITEMRRATLERETLYRRLREAEARQRRFVRETLFSLTDGRLLLCDTENDLPAPCCAQEGPLLLSRPALRELRQQTRAVAWDLGFSEERANDLVMAVGEAGMNAVVHGGGGLADICADAALGIVQVWIRDSGQGIEESTLHRAVLERGYSSTGSLGHGFSMLLQTCDRVYLLTSAAGTTVVLEQEKNPLDPVWLQNRALSLEASST